MVMLKNERSSEDQPVQRKKPMKYWLVEITLTSGEILEFYVSGLTKFDADEKALGYQYWMTNEKLKSKLSKFRLMP
jgi:hypothetical protein